MNELTVFFASYHLICFTDLVEDLERESDVGWSIIALICLNILINMGIFIYVVTTMAKRRCKRARSLKLAKQRHEAMMKARQEKSKTVLAKTKVPVANAKKEAQ